MSDLSTEDELLNRKQAARYTGYSPGTLAVWRSTGRYNLPIVKIGRSVRYRRSDLNKFILDRLTR